MARKQTLVQLNDDLLSRLDARVARDGRSRSDLIRSALEDYFKADRDGEIDRQIVEAYTRQPQSSEDLAFAEARGRALIEAEPWGPSQR